MFNKALLGKWLCRFGVEGDVLWRKVIVDTYERGWRSNRITMPFGCGMKGEAFYDDIGFKVGVGS